VRFMRVAPSHPADVMVECFRSWAEFAMSPTNHTNGLSL
jgi:hypothetical protein